MTDFRNMRRSKQLLPREETLDILRTATSGVLSVIGDDGYPYGVPLSYVYDDGHLYFHCAKSGHKLDAIRACSKASFTVIAADDVLPERYATNYRSVIAFGNVTVIEDEAETLRTIRLLGDRYNPGHMNATEAEIASSVAHMYILDFCIEHMTGKEGLYLAQMRTSN